MMHSSKLAMSHPVCRQVNNEPHQTRAEREASETKRPLRSDPTPAPPQTEPGPDVLTQGVAPGAVDQGYSLNEAESQSPQHPEQREHQPTPYVAKYVTRTRR